MPASQIGATDIIDPITKDPRLALAAAKEMYQRAIDSGDEWLMPENIERSLLQSWRHAVTFAHDTMRGRWRAFEDTVEGSPTVMDRSALLYLFNYAKNVIRGPFEAAERHIATDPVTALQYAQYVLQAPYDEGHPAIATINATYETKIAYQKYFEPELKQSSRDADLRFG